MNYFGTVDFFLRPYSTILIILLWLCLRLFCPLSGDTFIHFILIHPVFFLDHRPLPPSPASFSALSQSNGCQCHYTSLHIIIMLRFILFRFISLLLNSSSPLSSSSSPYSSCSSSSYCYYSVFLLITSGWWTMQVPSHEPKAPNYVASFLMEKQLHLISRYTQSHDYTIYIICIHNYTCFRVFNWIVC